MNLLGKALAGVLAAVVLAISNVALAADPVKIYSLNVSAYTGSNVSVTIRNETPNGNSTINSFYIIPPVPVELGSPSSVVQAGSLAQVTKDPATGYIYVKQFTGLQAGNKTPKSITINLIGTYPAATSCGSTFGWAAKVFAGNSWGQEEFDPVAVSGTTQTQSLPCNYSVNVAPSSLPAGASTSLTLPTPAGLLPAMTAVIKNENPAGGQSLASATLTAPAGLKITGVSVPSGSASVNGAGTVITLSGLSIAPQASATVRIAVDTACAASSANWATTAAASGGGSFSLLTGSSALGTAVTGSCSLAFQTQPSNVIAGDPITPNVVVVARGANTSNVAWFGGPVTLTTGTTCGVGEIASTSAVAGTATFGGLVLTTAGTYTLRACSAIGTATTSFAISSTPFTVYGGGPLECKPGDPYQFENILPPGVTSVTQPGFAEGERGAWNNYGSDCIAVGYTFTNNILNDNSVLLKWDTSNNQSSAAFRYTMTWKPEYVDASTGLPNRVTKLAWFDPVSGNSLTSAVPGRSCLSSQLPAPYGTLDAAISAGVLSITIDTGFGGSPPSGKPIATLPTPPFPLNIGGERLTATALTSSSGTLRTYAVTRGGTNGTPNGSHAKDDKVMSTPLPLDSSGTEMRMCIVEEGWTAYPPGVNDCATSATTGTKIPAIPPTTPLACVLYTTTVFDLGDGFVVRAP